MKLTQLLESNPGYNIDWFQKVLLPLVTELAFVECKECNFIYSNERLNDDLLFQYYNQGIDENKSLNKIFARKKRKQLIQIWMHLINRCELDSPIRVIDYGAGWGDFLSVANCIGVDVYGIEYDKRKIDFARKAGYLCGDYPFALDNSPYDIFMCNQVLEHLDEPRAALNQLRALLKPGAVGFISVPNFPKRRINEQVSLIKKGKNPSKDFDPLGHLNYFDGNYLRAMLRETGFREYKEQKGKSFLRLVKNRLDLVLGKKVYEPSIYVVAI